MQKTRCKHIYGFMLAVFLLACGETNKAPDVSGIEISSSLIRFDSLLFNLDTSQIESGIRSLEQSYPDFSGVFFDRVMGLPSDQYRGKALAQFLQDSLVKSIYQESQHHFARFDPFEAELRTALKHFRFYFPEFAIPDIYTCISGFEVGSFTIGPEILGIGLDFFLGADYAYYDPMLFPVYIKATMEPEYLVPKSMQALIGHYLGEPGGTRLIDYMIRNGIELYIKQKLLPETPARVNMEFTSTQLEWMRNNEAQIWAFLLEEDLLYSVDYRRFQKLITPSPNVPNMPPEAPGRLANWVGYRIISDYMEAHPNESLTDLLEDSDPQIILAESGYKPRH